MNNTITLQELLSVWLRQVNGKVRTFVSERMKPATAWLSRSSANWQRFRVACLRFWLELVENHYLMSEDTENKKAAEHTANATHYKQRAAVARADRMRLM